MAETINHPKSGKLIAKTWCPVEQIERSALDQIQNFASIPFLFKWAAIMPDCHTGIGATIGSVIPTEDVVIPSAVGVDIGCGMCSVKTSLHVDDVRDRLREIAREIKRSIPSGFDHRDIGDKTPREYIDKPEFWWQVDELGARYSDKPIAPQLGTLGGGNHFIELQQDADAAVHIMLHSGSRNIGLTIATTHIKKAREWAKKHRYPVARDLEFMRVDSAEGDRYLEEMTWALDIAFWNRYVMMRVIEQKLREFFPGVAFEPMINIHHNYVAREHHFGKHVWVHRKGATRVTSQIIGIIPGSMGSRSYLVRGTDHAESFNSCSHGAGRRMGRKEAQRRLDMESFRAQMAGVASWDVDKSHLDEAPDAYKSIDEVMSNQRELVDIVTELTPIMNVKG